jgi:ribosomal protein S18 acetylase RimI-like enzyme
VAEPDSQQISIRRASTGDAHTVARLLHDFNTEFDEPSPGIAVLGERVGRLIGAAELTVLIAGLADGVAAIRFRPSIWADGDEAHLQELYVVPGRRGEGIGRTLLEATIELAIAEGAAGIDLNTSTDDVAARALYESAGFTNREGRPDGPQMLFYEREL